MKNPKFLGSLGTIALCLSGCGTSKPCADAGDTSWVQPVVGNRQCRQIKRTDGTYINDGRYVVWSPSGKILLEGAFKQGRKDGTWTQYDEAGRKLVEKHYVDGTER